MGTNAGGTPHYKLGAAGKSVEATMERSQTRIAAAVRGRCEPAETRKMVANAQTDREMLLHRDSVYPRPPSSGRPPYAGRPPLGTRPAFASCGAALARAARLELE